MGRGPVRVVFYSDAEELRRGGVVPDLMGQRSQQEIRFGVVGVNPQNLLVGGLGRLKTANLVVFQAAIQKTLYFSFRVRDQGVVSGSAWRE